MDILEKILAQKRVEVSRLQARAEDEDWESLAREAPTPPDFEQSLRTAGRIRVIAEIKKASPSAGVLREPFHPAEIAQSYSSHGADALSVLTDETFFHGSMDDLRAVRDAVALPILRKDFVIDPIQIFEAKLAGASAVLLIAECLSPEQLADFVSLAHSLQLGALVELHERENVLSAVDSGARIIGINNRNLRTFETCLEHTLDLMEDIPNDRIVVSESGIRTREDVLLLSRGGVTAILVGETFMRSPDPGSKLAELIH